MGSENIRTLLDAGEKTRAWLEHLDAVGEPDFEVDLPSIDDLPRLLLDLAVPHEDIDDLVAMRRLLVKSDDLWWLLRRCVHVLVNKMGTIGEVPSFPLLPAEIGPLQRYFYIYVFVATLPHIRTYHRNHEIPPDVSRLTLADLGRNMAVHRMRHGTGGLDVPFWITLHFTGAIYELGRLQFERARLGNRTGLGVRAAGLPYGPGDPALGVHVPEFYGSITPTACDRSFGRAVEFFPRHFPAESYGVATCHSWLLDDQLEQYLAQDTNIIQFQRRFRPAYQPSDTNRDIITFVFGKTDPDLTSLPRTTTLQRSILDHIAAGRYWHGGAGFVDLRQLVASSEVDGS